MRGAELASFVARLPASSLAPWELTARACAVVEPLLPTGGAGFNAADGVAVHDSARIEPGATVKDPAVIGPGCLTD